MYLKKTTFLAGFVLALSIANCFGWPFVTMRHRYSPAPYPLAKCNGFPVIQFSDPSNFLDRWSAFPNDQFWPLGLPFEDDWGGNLFDSPKTSGDDVVQETQRLDRLYTESVDRYRKAHEDMTAIKTELDRLTGRQSVRRDSRAECQSRGSQRQHTHDQPCRRQGNPTPIQGELNHPPHSESRYRKRQPHSDQRQPHHRELGQPEHEQRPSQSTQRQSRPTQRQTQPPQRQSQPTQRQIQPTQRQPDPTQRQSKPTERQPVPATHSQREPIPAQRDIHQSQSDESINQSDDAGHHHRQAYTERTLYPDHDVTNPAPMQDVIVIPTRGFHPRDLNIRHHGNSIRVHASRTCDDSKTCVTREMETSYKLPFEIERGSMKASFDGSNMIIKGRPVRSHHLHIHDEEAPDDSVFQGELGDSSSSFTNENSEENHWTVEDADSDSGVYIESEDY